MIIVVVQSHYLRYSAHRRWKGSVVGGGTMTSAEHEPITGALGAEPLVSSGVISAKHWGGSNISYSTTSPSSLL